VNGWLGFGLFAGLFAGLLGVNSSFVFLGKISTSNDWLLEVVNQFAHKIIHVLGLVVALQAIGVLPLL